MKEGWTYKKLGDVAKVQNGFAFDSKLFNENNNGTPLIRIRDIKRGFSYTYTTEKCDKDYVIENGNLLIGMDGDFNVCEWNGGHAYLNQRVCRVIPSEAILSRFLLYLLPFPLKHINDKTSYATVKHLSSKQVLNINVPYITVSEQQRIVAQLDEAFAEIDMIKTEAEKQLSDAKALFQKALSQAMTPKEGWEKKTLGELATSMYRGSGIRRDQVTKEGMPCVRYGEIYTTYNIAFDDCVSHSKEEYISSPKYFEHGDLLFAITGESVEDIGKTIAYLGYEKCLLGGDIICMKHRQNPKFMAYALSTEDAIKQKGLGKTKLKVVHTNAPALKSISIPLPPLSEQQRIVEELDELSENVKEIEALNNKLKAECDAMKQALLRQVFE